ncbi:MAG: hypothetical protein HY291_09500 [Planctomycetes bacterium]|nr:hypothetical protein [Planctomycetota bacterium]
MGTLRLLPFHLFLSVLAPACDAAEAPAIPIPLGPLGASAEKAGEAADSRRLKIVSVVNGDSAQRAGLKAGDVLDVPGSGTPLQALMQLLATAQGAPEAVKAHVASLKWDVLRDGKPVSLEFKLPVLGAHAATCPANCPACQAQLSKSLDWLAAQVAKGYRPSRTFDLLDRGPFYIGKMVNGMKVSQSRPYTVAVTAMAGLALLAAGEAPRTGPHAAALAACRDYVAMSVQTWQLPAAQAGGEVEQDYDDWALGYSGLFLAECLAQDPTDAAQKKSLEKTLEWLAKRLGENQEDNGAWAHKGHAVNRLGYKEFTAPALVILPALASIKARGIAVPEAAIAKGVKYLKDVQDESGGYAYSPERKGYIQIGRVGGALWALALCGEAPGEANFKRGADFFLAHPEHALNGHGSQMMNLLWSGFGAAALGPEAWGKVWEANKHWVFAARQNDGSFAPLPRQEFGYFEGRADLLNSYDADTEQYLGAGEPKAIAVWIAAHQLVFWQTGSRHLSWLKPLLPKK